MRFELREATDDDEKFLEDLYATSRDFDMVHAPWTDLQKRVFLDSQGRLQREHYAKFFPRSQQHIILVDNEPAGRLYVDRTPNEIHLMDICLLPEYRGKSIGQALLDDLIAESQQTGIRIWCTVSLLNHGSQKFFKRNGFAVIKEEGPNVEFERRA